MRDTVHFEYDRERLDRQARERGYDSIQAYLEALIEDDIDVMADLRQAFQEVKAGKFLTADELLASLDKDNDD